jgi:hypothetical protein
MFLNFEFCLDFLRTGPKYEPGPSLSDGFLFMYLQVCDCHVRGCLWYLEAEFPVMNQ